MSVIWAKVWRDLAHNRARTILVVASTAVGVFALGLIIGLGGILRARMTEDHRSRLPGHINFFRVTPFDEGTVEAIRREAGVLDAEAQVQTTIRWRLEGDTVWRDGNLAARADYTAQRMDLVDLVAGRWPTEHGVAVTGQSSVYFGIPLGATVIIERGRREERLPIVGIVRMPMGFFAPPQIGGNATFFVTPETAAWLIGQEGFNQLNVRLESFDQESATALADRLRSRLARMSISVGSYTITDPNVHWLQAQVDTLFLILAVLGWLSLGLSAFLIINTMNAIIVRQVWQIGVMKVFGATAGRVMVVYLMIALAYGVLALLPAIPLAALTAYWMSGWLLGLMGIAGGTFQMMPDAAGIQAAVGMAVPLLAAAAPVAGGARITPHRAISSYGLEAGFGQGALDRLIGRIRHLPRTLAFSLRNTFRRKGRAALTLFTLILAGAMFIVVMSVRSSLEHTFEIVLGDFGFDLLVALDRPYQASRVVEIADSIPGVVRAEAWERRLADLELPDGSSRQVILWGVPEDTTMFRPNIVAGRGLLADDNRAILLNTKIATDEGIHVGDEVRLTINGRESTWTVVGLILSVSNNQRENFVPFDALTRMLGRVNRASVVVATSEYQDLERQQALTDALRAVYTARHIEPISLQSAGQLREQNRTQFDVITYLLLSMAVLAAAVGSIGLAGTMSITVVERRREIGVMRAIGAMSPAIAGIFVSEGVLLGMWSWLLAVPLSIPGARLFSRAVGEALLQAPLNFRYSPAGVLMWLLIVILLSALASLWPALQATRVSVREALAYE